MGSDHHSLRQRCLFVIYSSNHLFPPSTDSFMSTLEKDFLRLEIPHNIKKKRGKLYNANT